jgi:hypothetical protein
MQLKWAALQTGDAKLKRMANGGFSACGRSVLHRTCPGRGVRLGRSVLARWAVECTHPRAEVNYAGRPKRLRMNSISYKLTEGVHGRWPDRQGSIWIGNLIYKEL